MESLLTSARQADDIIVYTLYIHLPSGASSIISLQRTVNLSPYILFSFFFLSCRGEPVRVGTVAGVIAHGQHGGPGERHSPLHKLTSECYIYCLWMDGELCCVPAIPSISSKVSLPHVHCIYFI